MNTQRSFLQGSSFCRIIFVLLVLTGIQVVPAWGQTPGIPQFAPNKLIGTDIVKNATMNSNIPVQGEKDQSFRDVVSLNINEESPSFLPENFAATVTVDIDYGADEAHTTRIPGVSLTVNYSKDAGANYDTKKYIRFSDARYVKVTIVNDPVIAPASLSNGVNVLSLLTLKCEIIGTLFFDLNANLLPDNMPAPAPLCPQGSTIVPDELPVTWHWPSGALNNGTQLEWTFVPDDVPAPAMNGDGTVNGQLFNNNSTRVDLPLGVSSYNIPLFYEGSGTIYYRIRAVNYLLSGGRADGPWANGQPVAFCGHSPNLNWQVNTAYAEDGKRKTVMQYYDGSLRLRQTVTKDNSTNSTITAETFYDGQGRPAIQVLPAPGTNNILGFTAGINLFQSPGPGISDQTLQDDPATFFDLKPISGGISGTPPLLNTSGTARYYSPANDEITENGNGNIPDAGGYPYTVTRYTPDATGRIMSQSGVGPNFRMTSGHETKYFYGSAPQEQLDGLFGTEVGLSPHYFKNMVQEANGQVSVSYVDMHGRTIATALAGDNPRLPDNTPRLAALDLTQYPGQGGSTLIQNLLPTGANLIKGNSVESITSLLVPTPEVHSFKYSLTPDALHWQDCGHPTPTTTCYDCQYDLEITITDESGEQAPYIRKFTNVDLSSATTCPTPNPKWQDKHYSADDPSTIDANGVISFDKYLPQGSYTVKKTLTVNDQLKRQLRDQYISTLLCINEDAIIDSLKTVIEAQTNCAAPKIPCTDCGVSTLALIRSQMLGDMMPFTGQYARDPNDNSHDVSSTTFNTYNIFHTNEYKSPSGGVYKNDAGIQDLSISSTDLSVMTPEQFTNAFTPSWAEQLLPYHPEYNQLQFAEGHLTSAYSWMDRFRTITTWATDDNSRPADPNGFHYQTTVNTEDIDPAFVAMSSQKSYIHNLATGSGYYSDKLNFWKIAYGNVKCQGDPSSSGVNGCYQGAPADPSGWSTSLTTAEKDQIWLNYQQLYSAVRDSLMHVYIQQSTTEPDMQRIVDDHYILRFPASNNLVFQQFGFTGFPATAGDPPTVSLTDLANGTHTTQCSSYITEWTQQLLTCPTLAARSDAQTIISEITTRMEAVCERGLDASNPHGSSTVAPGNVVTGGDNSFEDVITNVFQAHNIPLSQLCNPFVIDYPKPYGKNPQVNQEVMTVVDQCACDRFAALKQEAGTTDFTMLNTYLLATYGETLTQAEFDALGNCSIITDGQPSCWSYTVPLDGGSCPCVSSTTTDASGHQNTTCTCNVCRIITQYPLSSPQPKPAFLDCGFTPNSHCLTCSQLSKYAADFKAYFVGQDCAAGPILDKASDLTDVQIGYNIAFAQFVNYRSGLQLSWMDYINAASTTSCNLAVANVGNNTTVICGNTKPLSDASDLVETEGPCDKADQKAVAIGHQIYAQRVADAQAAFDKWYADKCLSTAETFNVTYDVKEYHYTLYYYDQAGNLVKTVPPKGVRPDFSTAYINSVESARSTNGDVPTNHLLESDYRYNSLNLAVAQKTPDANTSLFWYDNLGRLVVSQNAQQAQDGKYSYTRFDPLSRVFEVGQKPQSALMNQTTSQSPGLLDGWITDPATNREQVTLTFYDESPIFASGLLNPQNLRNRISYTSTLALVDDNIWNATAYSYDVHGNVAAILHNFGAVPGISPNDQFKLISYDYDLVSNKVNGVDYQHGRDFGEGKDEFYHRYRYDAENRLVQVLTSRDSFFWEQDAAYDYYKHGPLARTVLGQLQTQELRYSYTLQGWLKGVNSGGLFNYVPPATGASDGSNCKPGTYQNDLDIISRPATGGPATYTARNSITFEPGFTADASLGGGFETAVDGGLAVCIVGSLDGKNGIFHTDPLSFPIAQDAYNFSLHYYPGDYAPINATTPQTGVLEALPSQAAPLFNGNIAAMAVNVPLTGNASFPLSDAGAKVYNYHYDQLNRLVVMDAFDGLNTATHAFSPTHLDHYQEQVSYDPNGNILTYNRNGNLATAEAMDRLLYTYSSTNNQLNTLVDNASDGSYTTDIKAPTTAPIQYQYDLIGNITQEKINATNTTNNINWTVYGKIATQSGLNGLISYQYDAGSNRITKTSSTGTTLYVRDAQGNVLATYQKGASGGFVESEIDLYGSNRIGLLRAPALPSQTIALTTTMSAYVMSFTRGQKAFELANHLGNVLATITDKKIAVSSGTNSSLIDHYTADVATAQDYYPFGMRMPGRMYPSNGSTNYRYGFNGKENDDEVKGVGDQQDYGMRIYDPRIGKFISSDPITRQFPNLTPYQFASNNPIENIDIDGLEGYSTTKGGALWEGFKDGAALTVTGHVTNGQNAPHFSVSQIPGKWGRALTMMKTIESFVPNVPGMDALKSVTFIESAVNQGLEAQYKANESGHVGWYAAGMFTEKVLEVWVIRKVGGKVGNWVETRASTEPVTLNVDRSAGSESLDLPRMDEQYGNLTIEGTGYSESELNAAKYMQQLGNDVVLRKPTGLRGQGGTSDLLVNSKISYDVYTPETSNPDRIISAIAKKNSQATGVIIDLSKTTVTEGQLGNVMKRLQGAGAKKITDVKIIGQH